MKHRTIFRYGADCHGDRIGSRPYRLGALSPRPRASLRATMEIQVTHVDLLDASSTTGLLDATVGSLARPCPLRRQAMDGYGVVDRVARCMRHERTMRLATMSSVICLVCRQVFC